ncbi:MAG: DUF4388 domain-containing protein [Acidobacteriota bacterium]
MNAKGHARQGILSATTFPTLIYSISSHRNTGILTLSNEGVEKSVYIQAGRPVFASSNDIDDRLGQVFFQAGRITLEGLLEAVDASLRRRKRLGTILVERGLIESGDLVEGVRTQVRNIIIGLFLWSTGRYRYAAGPLPTEEVITLRLNAGQLVLEGIRQIRSWDRIWKAVGDLDARYCAAPGASGASRGLHLAPQERSLLEHCREPIGLRDLCRASPMSDFEICRLLWALRTLGIINRVAGEG